MTEGRGRGPAARPVTRAEFDAMRADLDELREMKAMIVAMHGALMVAQPGHKEPLIHRMGAVVVGIEAGDRAAKTIMRAAQIITALGIISGAFYVWRHGGNPPK